MRSGLGRWWVLTCSLVLLVVATINILIEVVSKDGTGITLVIIGLFLICHFAIAKLLTSYSEGLENKVTFIAEFLVALGLIGTVTGFMILFGDAFANIDVSDTESITAVLTDMASGLGTALVTTLFGLVGRWAILSEIEFLIGGDK